MGKRLLLVWAIMFISVHLCHSQDDPLSDSLKNNLQLAKSPAEKILWLGELAGFYTNLNNELADKYGNQQLDIAEASRERVLILKALLSNSHRFFNSNGVQENINRARQFAQRALDMARSNHLDEYIAWSYIYLARSARSDGQNDKALNYNTLAVSIASTLPSDSLKISAFNALGDTYLRRQEKLLAFRSYLQALNLAETIQNYEQMRLCYFNMADFYSELEDYEKAKDYLFKVQRITIDFNQPFDRLNAYRSLGGVYSRNKQYNIATQYYEKIIMLSDTLKFEVYKLNAYFDIINQYLESNQGQQALNYLKEKPALKEYLINSNYDFYLYQIYAAAYMALGKYDSAGYHFKKAESGFESKTDSYSRYWFYYGYSKYFKKTGDHKNALAYLLKAQTIGDERKDIILLQRVSADLDTAYQNLGDFKSAYMHKAQYFLYKDSLQKLSTEKDLMALEVDNENRRKLREAELEEQAKRERHNIQYMGITAGIAGVFIVLVMLGAFSVSKTTIRILGFFAFIFLFEFIILLADNKIHHWTHGEPWKILAIKIALISILLPLHHFLEEKVIHFLTTRKLLEVRTKGLFNKLTRKSETDPLLKP